MEDKNSNASHTIQEVPPNPSQEVGPSPELASKTHMTAQEAEALLTVNNLQVSNKKSKNSKWLLIVIIVSVLLITGADLISIAGKKTTSSSSGLSLPTSKNNPLNSGNINQQVKYCSNLINASTVC
jgi:hypothetical protein